MIRYLRANCVIIASQMIASIVLILATHARAHNFFTAGVSVNGVQDSITLSDSFDGPLPYRGSALVSDAPGLAAARGSVDFGRSSLSAGVVLNVAQGQDGTTVAEANAGWSDTFAIFPPDDNPGLAGTTGKHIYFFDIEGTVTATKFIALSPDQNPVRALYSTQITLGGLPGGRHERYLEFGCHARFGDTVCGGTPPGLHSFEVDFIWGFPISIDVHNRVFASAHNTFSSQEQASAGADFSHTFSWGGFGEVRDFNGNLVTGYHVESASGVDYSQPVVSEPANALAAFPIAYLLIARRARNRSKGNTTCEIRIRFGSSLSNSSRASSLRPPPAIPCELAPGGRG